MLVVAGVTVVSRPSIWYFYYIWSRYGEEGEGPVTTPLSSPLTPLSRSVTIKPVLSRSVDFGGFIRFLLLFLITH